MMKSLLRLLSLMLALTLYTGLACAETAATPDANAVIATVNGEELLYADYAVVENSFLAEYYNAGINLEDPAILAYVQDVALTYAIERMLLEQDMRAQGCYNFDDETVVWLNDQAKAAYLSALNQVAEMFRAENPEATEAELQDYALDYAQTLGVSVQSYVNVLSNQYATVMYYEWLMGGETIDEAAVLAAYDARVADSKTRFENNPSAFEQAVLTGEEVWYKPEGYRSVLQILLKSEGTTDAEKLAGVQSKVDDIYTRLEKGETFQSLIALYGEDEAFQDPAFYEAGYQVHRDSVIWDSNFIAAAFSEEMAKPGCWSKPVIGTSGVHILYYLNDSPGGSVQLSQELYDALAYALYSEKTEALVAERLNKLIDEAEVVIH